MLQIDIDFDAIREKLYDIVDAVLEAGLHLEDKINTAFEAQKPVVLDIESYNPRAFFYGDTSGWFDHYYNNTKK